MSNIPDGINRQDVLDALVALDGGIEHHFRGSTGYDLVENGRRYPPKAVLGLAAKRLLGKQLEPFEFKGGASTQCFRILKGLGFIIEAKPEPKGRGGDWSKEEVRVTVDDYFAMLLKQCLGQPYRKVEHCRALVQRLSGRSEESIDYKYRSISTVLAEEGQPYVEGYVPAANCEGSVREVVLEYLESDEPRVAAIHQAIGRVPERAPLEIDYSKCEADPPPPPESRPYGSRRRGRIRARHIDYAARDAANRKLGLAGEQFVAEVERDRLLRAGLPELAVRVEHVAVKRGDGEGYDIASFDPEDRQPIFIEVKTTNCPANTPFFLSSAEVEFSVGCGNRYRLYRVYSFATRRRYFCVKGPVVDSFELKPTEYRARRR